MKVRVWSVDVTENVCHTGLEAHEGGEVRVLGGVVTWEGSDLTAVLASTLSGEEPEGTVSGATELSVRHLG